MTALDSDLLLSLGIAAGLGLLVGLQRERSKHAMAGIRTFPLIAILGVLGGWLAQEQGGWIVAGGFVAVAGLTMLANWIRARVSDDVDPGMTTEVAILVMFGVGAALAMGAVLEGVVVGAGVALLLHWKAPLHAFAEKLGSADFAAIMRLTLLTLVILPVLPNRAYGPYEVINPFQIWLMVVLIVGISLGGYVAYRLFGERAGPLAAGALGGLISSTATSVSYARRSADRPQRSEAAALVVTLASTVVFFRVLVELAVVSRSALAASWMPLTAMTCLMILVSLGLFLFGAGPPAPEREDREPPSTLGSALVFGLLYAAVLLGVAFAQDRFGQSGAYVVAGLSGLTDVDAITLSTAQLLETGEVGRDLGWRLILVGSLANLVFKGGVVALMGSPSMRARIGVAFTAAIGGGTAILLLWPG